MTEIFGEHVLVWLGPVPLTRTMLTSALTSGALLALGRAVARAVASRPQTRLAAAGRLAIGFLRDLTQQATGHDTPVLQAFLGALFSFIAGATLVGQLPGISAPTANLPAAAALAALVFLAVPIAGVRSRGLFGYLKHYLQPNPLLFPLHVISELSRTLALALRLFGNMMSGHLVVALIVALAGVLVPVPLMALDLLIGLLQAYIFTILAGVYIGAAMRLGESD
ncbi:MAG: F0F1 ATP synthase subunit A [Myxococcales bacterium]|nr:F0F1 ATP synthase subunit A [Myxococcales bacterium]